MYKFDILLFLNLQDFLIIRIYIEILLPFFLQEKRNKFLCWNLLPECWLRFPAWGWTQICKQGRLHTKARTQDFSPFRGITPLAVFHPLKGISLFSSPWEVISLLPPPDKRFYPFYLPLRGIIHFTSPWGDTPLYLTLRGISLLYTDYLEF